MTAALLANWLALTLAAPAPLPRQPRHEPCPWPCGVWEAPAHSSGGVCRVTLRPGGRYVEEYDTGQVYRGRWHVEGGSVMLGLGAACEYAPPWRMTPDGALMRSDWLSAPFRRVR